MRPAQGRGPLQLRKQVERRSVPPRASRGRLRYRWAARTRLRLSRPRRRGGRGAAACSRSTLRGFGTPTKPRGARRSTRAACSSTAAAPPRTSRCTRATSSSSIARRGTSPTRRVVRRRLRGRARARRRQAGRAAGAACGPVLAHTLLQLVRASHPSRAERAPAHRLGRGTSGLIAFGKSASRAPSLAHQFREFALAQDLSRVGRGRALPDSFAARQPIGRVAHGPLQIYAAADDGKASLTRVRVLRRESAGARALVAAQPITGRPDQIRIHLAAAGRRSSAIRCSAPAARRRAMRRPARAAICCMRPRCRSRIPRAARASNCARDPIGCRATMSRLGRGDEDERCAQGRSCSIVGRRRLAGEFAMAPSSDAEYPAHVRR